MTYNQYIEQIEEIINSPRSDSQKIARLTGAFEQYTTDVVGVLEEFKHCCRDNELARFGFDRAIFAIKAGGQK